MSEAQDENTSVFCASCHRVSDSRLCLCVDGCVCACVCVQVGAFRGCVAAVSTPATCGLTEGTAGGGLCCGAPAAARGPARSSALSSAPPASLFLCCYRIASFQLGQFWTF